MSVNVYIDGFNLYHAMKDRKWAKYYWLDVNKFAVKALQIAKSKGFVQSGLNIQSTKFFTSRLTPLSKTGEEKAARQTTYLEALEANAHSRKIDFSIIYGQFQFAEFECPKCGRKTRIPKEKMTDVNIATELLVDAFYDKFLVAILISGDSDLTSPIVYIKEGFSEKRVIAGFPPDRWAKQVAEACDGRYLLFDERIFRQSQLPQVVERADGHKLIRPTSWH